MATDNQIEGGSGPALAAHSKDASVPGTNPASSATGDKHGGGAGTATGGSDTANSMVERARAAADKLADSASNAAAQARQRFSQQATADQVGNFVRENPVVALLAAGVVGVIFGSLLPKR